LLRCDADFENVNFCVDVFIQTIWIVKVAFYVKLPFELKWFNVTWLFPAVVHTQLHPVCCY